MTINTQVKISSLKNYYQYLKDNSFWIKELNRSDKNIEKFIEYCKEKYSLRITDKISNVIDNIDLIQNVLSTLQ